MTLPEREKVLRNEKKPGYTIEMLKKILRKEKYQEKV